MEWNMDIERKWEASFVHIVDDIAHQGMNQSASGVFRISSDSGDAAHRHNVILNVDLHGINNDHGCQLFFIKPTEYISVLENRTFGIFDFLLLPAGLEELVGGYLKAYCKSALNCSRSL